MKKEYFSPEADIELFKILSCIITASAGWEEEDPNPFGRISEGEENPWG